MHANQLHPEQLRCFAENAARTNTELLLITTPVRQPKTPHSLIAVLTNLPWAQQLASPVAIACKPAPLSSALNATSPPRAAPATRAARASNCCSAAIGLHTYDYLIADHFQAQDRLRSRDQDNGLQV